ncbi:hypothetical protein DOY81_009918 [Sarcophaga bullata]|nr:hypothetical protein DOY81_009918 [Sarcophaga bullata]
MTSLGMGMNGGILGVPMGFLDFAPEPPGTISNTSYGYRTR